MRYELGDFVKRNAKVMIYPTINTTNDVKHIARDNEYKIVSRRSAAAGYVYGIKSLQTNMCYDVANCDMSDFFTPIDNPTQEMVEKSTQPTEVPKPTRPCTCDSLDLFRFGCECGAIPNSHELKYNNMLSDMMGPVREE